MPVAGSAFPKVGVESDTASGAYAMAAAIAHSPSVHQPSKRFLAAGTGPLLVVMVGTFGSFPPKLLQLRFQFPVSSQKKKKCSLGETTK